jgi:tetratricopeptide (TPR) repeat protein
VAAFLAAAGLNSFWFIVVRHLCSGFSRAAAGTLRRMAEKTLNDLPPDLRRIFTKGTEALQKDNFDYAISLFEQVLAREPAMFPARRALRAAQQGKSGGGGGFFKKAWSSASSSPQVLKAQAALRTGNTTEALAIAEQILNGDANNSGAHRVVVEAATQMEMPQTAVMSLEVLVKNNPRDKELAIQFANTVADTGDPKAAERVLAEFARQMPNDPEVLQALKNVTARRTMGEGGYEKIAEGKGSYRDILRNEDEAKALEQENRVQKTEDVAVRLIDDYEARLKSEPDNFKLIRSLAELYTQKKQFDRAVALYDRIKASDVGNDPSLDRAIAETKARQFDHKVETLDPTAPDHAERVAQLNVDKLAFQIAECQRRVEKFPTDNAIRFEMGQLYFQAGRFGEAIKEFQKARDNPHRRIAAMNYLAQCFARRKMFDLAAENLQDAIKEKPVFDEEKKDLVYQLGTVLESMGKKNEAIEQFKLIYKVDASYRDVEAKVDAFYAGQ